LRAFSREFAAIDLSTGPHDFRFHHHADIGADIGKVDLYDFADA
jgi:hypothetical protein